MRSSLRIRYARTLILMLAIFVCVETAVVLLYEYTGWRIFGSNAIPEKAAAALAVFVCGLVAIPLMTWVIVRATQQMMRPVKVIRQTAQRIIAGHLRERIVFENADDEIGMLSRTINHAFDRYQDALDRIQRFTSDASHQLRTPLTAVRSTGEVCLQKVRTPGEYCETIGSMLEEVQRLSDVVDKLLVLARLGASNIRRAFSDVDLGVHMRRVASDFEALCSSHDIRLVVEMPEGLVVRGDGALLEQMAANLIDNATRYTPPGGSITLWARRDPDTARIVLDIRDTGSGIPPVIKARLFQRFNRHEDSDRRGSGLGLAIVADIVAIHAGTIKLDESSPVGACFQIILPAADAPSGAAQD